MVPQSGRLRHAIQTALGFHEHGSLGLHVFCVVPWSHLDENIAFTPTLEIGDLLYIDLADEPIAVTSYS